MATAWNNVVNAVENTTEDLLDEFGLVTQNAPNLDEDSGTAPNSASGFYKDFISGEKIGPKIWFTEGADWHKVFGYRFSIAYISPSEASQNDVNIDGALNNLAQRGRPTPLEWFHFTLPIPPSQLVTKPIIPSKATATLGGVVEETSQVKFWLVSMNGTTGTSMSRLAEDRSKRKKMSSKFREVIETTGLLSGVSANINQAVSQIGGVADSVIGAGQAAIASGDFSGALSGVTGAVNNALTPPLPYSESGVDNRANGFVEAQELQKFFFMYNALKSRYPKNFALVFTNFKTDQSWRCIIKDFQLQQSAETPYLFRYSINLQGWGVRRSRDLLAGTDASESFDRFGSGGDLASVNTLTSRELLGVFSTTNSIARGQGV